MYALHSLYSPPGRFATLRLDRQIRLYLNTYNTYFSALCIIPSISYTCFATSLPIYLGCACPFQQRAFCPPDRIKPHSLGHPQPFVSATCHFFIEFEGIHPQFDHSHFYTVRLLPAIYLRLCLYPSDTRSL